MPAQCRASAPPQAGGRGGAGRDTTGPHRAPGSQGPAELEQLGREGGACLAYSSSEGASPWPPGWPIKPAHCPINRQRPCAAGQLQRPPRAGPPPTPRSSCPGPPILPCSESHPGLLELLARSQRDVAGSPAWGRGALWPHGHRMGHTGRPLWPQSPCVGRPLWPHGHPDGCPHRPQRSSHMGNFFRSRSRGYLFPIPHPRSCFSRDACHGAP